MISVVLITRNRAERLMKAIQSILAQSYKDFELLILNDGSEDNTEEVVKMFNDERIRYYKFEHIGIPKIRNKGTKLAKGEYIAIADDDDINCPNRLEEQAKLMNKYDVIYSDWYIQHYDSVNLFKSSPFNIARFLFSSLITHSTMLIRKELLERFPYNENAKYGTDYQMALEMAASGASFGYIDKPLIYKISHNQMVSLTNTDEQRNTAGKARDKYLNSLTIQQRKEIYDEWNNIKIEDDLKLGRLKISLIITFYNKKEVLIKLLESLKRQTYQHFEIIIVDDGSIEDIQDLLRNSEMDIKYYWHKDEGYRLCTARNTGRELANNPLLVFLDPDIIPIGDDFLERVAKRHLEENSILLTYSRIRKFEDKEELDKREIKPFKEWQNTCGGMMSIRSSDFDKVGRYDENYNGEWGIEDVDFGYRAVSRGIKVILDKSFQVLHLEHPVGDKSSKRNRAYFERKFGVKLE